MHLEWNLKEFHSGTNVIERTVNPDGSGTCNNCPTLAVIDRQQGSSTANLNFASGFGGRPWGEQCHSARLSLGTNEFGESRGYVTNHIPCLKLGSGVTSSTQLNGRSGSCICGGTPPPAGTIGASLTCPSSSYTTDCCPESEANCRGRTGPSSAPNPKAPCKDKTLADSVTWTDSDGYTCSEYHTGNQCVAYGSYVNAGMSANEACCTCGGGEQVRTN